MDVRYDPETGYLGTNVKTGESLLKISTFDRIFYMKNNGEYRVTSTTDKIFAGKEGIFYINYGDKEIISKEIFTMIYRDKIGDKKLWMIKRFQISAFSIDKTYTTIPEKAKKTKGQAKKAESGSDSGICRKRGKTAPASCKTP